MDSAWIAENAEKFGIITFLAFSIVALIKGWIVPQNIHQSVVSERDALRKTLDEANARDRAKLERTEALLDSLSARK